MKNPVAVITGAHGGIGAAVTAELISRSWTVVGLCRAAEQAERISTHHPYAEGLSVDVRVVGDIERAVAEVSSRYGVVDLLVNGAGVMPPQAIVATETLLDWSTTLDVNLTGAFLVCQGFLPLLEKSDHGRIVNITGGLGTFASGMPGGGQPSYRISKAGLNALSLTLAEELRDAGINVVSFDPGWVRTSMGGPDAPRAPDDVATELADLVDRMASTDLTGVRIAGGEVSPW